MTPAVLKWIEIQSWRRQLRCSGKSTKFYQVSRGLRRIRPGRGKPWLHPTKGNEDMMITFTSHASQKFSMQKDLAMVLLGVIGKTLGERGVITPEEMPHAIDRLKRAIKDDTHQAHIKVAELSASELDENGEEEPPHLGQRAYPLLHMLEESLVEQSSVLWGV
ncbi:uncharacterized protein DUF1840 [Ralstonia pickettii]